MRGYTFKVLESSEELRHFKRGYESSFLKQPRSTIEATVEVSYLEAARVTGLFDPAGQLVGGYVFNYRPPLLLHRTLPAETLGGWNARCPPSAQCELVGIWKERGLSQRFTAFALWPRIIRDCWRSGHRFILGLGYDNRMNEIYKIARPHLVYAGPRADKPELDQTVFVYAYTPTSITLTYVVNLVTELAVKPARRAFLASRGRR